jgi:hypothetical protein
MKKTALVLSALLMLALFLVPHRTFAAACANNSNRIVPVPGTLPQVGCGNDNQVLEKALKIAFGTLATISLLFIVIGGFRYTISGGDSNAIATAKKTIIYAVLGLVLGISVFVIVGFVFGNLL